MHDNLELIDLQDGTSTDGDVGFVVSGADDYRHYRVNIDGIRWLTLRVSSRTEGEVTANLLGLNTQ